MKKYEQQIQDYQKFVQERYIREEAERRTIGACTGILWEQTRRKQLLPASYFEFLYEQSGFIKKRWWILQGCALAFLWFWLAGCAADAKDTMRVMGIFATVFVILIVPEIWKNRRNGAIEIEQASYYTLRRVCSARILLFAAVDFVIVMIFLLAAHTTAAIPLYDLMINFLLPVNVSCCICFRLLCSRWGDSEYMAVFLCLVWVGVWTVIVTDDVIYQSVAAPVWGTLLVLTSAYFAFCVHKSLMFDEKILEGHTDGIGI